MTEQEVMLPSVLGFLASKCRFPSLISTIVLHLLSQTADAEPGFMTQHSVELVTPLVEACTRGHADIVEYLCDLHIKAKQQQQQQQQKRQDEQRADCTQLNLEWRTRTGETAMHLLCFNTRAYSLSYTPYGNRLQSKPPTPVKDVVRMLRALVDANADVNALTKSKETPLIYASRSWYM